MNMAMMGKTEKDWQAEDDLRTLIEAEKIRKDRARFKAAMTKRKQMMKDLENAGE